MAPRAGLIWPPPRGDRVEFLRWVRRVQTALSVLVLAALVAAGDLPWYVTLFVAALLVFGVLMQTRVIRMVEAAPAGAAVPRSVVRRRVGMVLGFLGLYMAGLVAAMLLGGFVALVVYVLVAFVAMQIAARTLVGRRPR